MATMTPLAAPHAAALNRLIAALNNYGDRCPDSETGEPTEHLESIDPSHAVHNAVVGLGQQYDDRQLPLKARLDWLELLELSRKRKKTRREVNAGYRFADSLNEWAKAEVAKLSGMAPPAGNGELSAFEPGGFWYKGKFIELGGDRLALLQGLIEGSLNHHKTFDGKCVGAVLKELDGDRIVEPESDVKVIGKLRSFLKAALKIRGELFPSVDGDRSSFRFNLDRSDFHR